MNENSFPARLHAIIAPERHIAVVFRRGPSKQVATYRWDLSADSFQLGQWLKGRIYERRCDLSPDGQHLLYFAMNGKWRSETGGSWTAVAKAPYLKALDLFAKGDCWEGGGLFLSNHKYWINDRYFDRSRALQSESGLRGDPKARPDVTFGAECTGPNNPNAADGIVKAPSKSRSHPAGRCASLPTSRSMRPSGKVATGTNTN